MEMALRWFGKLDPIPLKYIAQVPGVSGVVTSLMHIPAGEVWPLAECEAMRDEINAAGLTVKVIESVNIHEEIKLGSPERDGWIDRYVETLSNLAKIGIKIVCYNFMPVLDWARSHLFFDLPDDSNTMFFSREFMENTTPKALAVRYAEQSGGVALPGWEPDRLKTIEETIERYRSVSQEQYWENTAFFLRRIIPVAEELDIRMAIHPDDPPWPIFGLPRLINSRENIQRFLDLYPSAHNGLTLCTGSLGADRSNDIPAIIREFAGKVHFAHIRNLRHLDNGDFYESAHPTPYGSLDMPAIVRALKESGFDGVIRPDHGRMIWGETGRAGYGLYDRALGAAYLTGLWEAMDTR
ncbi:MAG: mannonate dehydratase [Oscillospiraceae bacterium]|jgi:mannonate dehydratase|nr:mannonate dehydratase [Oscillospiraceae bacterium]